VRRPAPGTKRPGILSLPSRRAPGRIAFRATRTATGDARGVLPDYGFPTKPCPAAIPRRRRVDSSHREISDRLRKDFGAVYLGVEKSSLPGRNYSVLCVIVLSAVVEPRWCSTPDTPYCRQRAAVAGCDGGPFSSWRLRGYGL